MGGELFDVVIERKHFTEADAASISAAVLSVMQHCHSKGIIHRGAPAAAEGGWLGVLGAGDVACAALCEVPLLVLPVVAAAAGGGAGAGGRGPGQPPRRARASPHPLRFTIRPCPEPRAQT